MPVRRPARAAFWLAGVFLMLALLAGCQPKVPQLPRLAADDVVLAFGDSLTHGTGATTAEAYPAQLQAIIGRQVVNAGVPGETTAQGLARLADALDTHAPRLVLLCLGGNDMLRRMDMAEAEANLRAMVRLIRERGIGLVLIGVPEPRLLSDPPAFYATVAEEFGLPYEGGVFDDVLKSPALKSDPIHPNAQGYRQVAEALAALLAEAGGLVMGALLKLARLIDGLNERVGRLVLWLVLAATLISAGNAVVRYGLNTSSNAWLEIQWYLFGLVFLLGAGYTLKHNGHVRIDVVYGRLSARGKAWVDLLGGLLFLLPMSGILAWLGWEFFLASYAQGETSPDAGGLLRWPIKLVVPVGFALLWLQGLAEVIKRAGVLWGGVPLDEEPERVPR